MNTRDQIRDAVEWMATCSPDPDALAAGRLHLLWTPGEAGPLITAITGDGPTSEANAKLLWAAHEYMPALVSDLRTAEARATAAEVASRGYRERAEKAEAKAARFAGLLGHQSRTLTDAIAAEVLRQKADAWDEGYAVGVGSGLDVRPIAHPTHGPRVAGRAATPPTTTEEAGSTAATSGYESTAKVEGEHSIAVAGGHHCRAMGSLGCWLVLAERDDNNAITHLEAVQVDGERIKPDVAYMLRDGQVVEA